MGDGELYKRHSTLQLAGEHTHVFKAILSLPTGEYQHPLDQMSSIGFPYAGTDCTVEK